MAKTDWTDDQKTAIYAPVGGLLVSAAAGSGKTAVLVNRVINRITGENHTDINRLLIVTFTKAAAGEMKQRLNAGLTQMLKDDPENANLKRQLMLLEKAQIGTMDSFFSNIVKDNFHKLERFGVTLDYTIMQENDFGVLSDEIVNELLEEYYLQGDDAFLRFIDYFTSDRSDSAVKDLLEEVHSFISSMYDWRYWVKNLPYLYTSEKSTILKEMVLRDAELDLRFVCRCYDDIISLCKGIDKLEEKYIPFFKSEQEKAQEIYSCIKSGDYDRTYELVHSISYDRMPSVSKEYADVKANIMELRSLCKNFMLKTVADKLCVTSEDCETDCALMYPVMKVFSRLIEDYEDKLLARKAEMASFEFSDISHFAMSLFVDDAGNITEYAAEVSGQFDEIYIDECQDTNALQNSFFDIISDGGKKMFLVGDAKQSIYRFRQAEPRLFISRMKNMTEYNPKLGGGYILLKNNFRSSQGVIDFVNFIFKSLMSEDAGDIAYDETQQLTAGRSDFSGEICPAELHLIKAVPADAGEKKAHFEQRYLAKLVKDKVDGAELIYDEKTGSMRPIEYDDICVLLRSTTKLSGYVEAFESLGIPTYSCASAGFYKQSEVRFVIDFMKAVDNPLRDVELLSVMYSPVFGFTPDDLAQVSLMGERGDSLYSKVLKAASRSNGKCADFCEKFSNLKSYSMSHTPSEFLEQLYFELGYYSLVGAQPYGERCQANLIMLLDVVNGFESGGYCGMSSLVRYIDRIAQTGDRVKCAYVAATHSKVTFMTIHASKGLQYPVVILADCESPIKVSSADILFHKNIGAGARYKDVNYGYKNTTIAYEAVKLSNRNSDISEELRLLYVALTRAQQKIIIIGGIGKNTVSKNSVCLDSGGAVDAACVRSARNYTDLFLSAVIHHPCAQSLRCELPYPVKVSDTPGQLKVTVADYFEQESVPAAVGECSADEHLLGELEKRFDYRYKYSGIFGVGSKATASGLNRDAVPISEWEFSRPSFMDEQGLVGADRGTALHRFMECARLEDLADSFDSQLSFFTEKGFLSEAQAHAVSRRSVMAFCSSPLYRQILSCDSYLREYRFSFLIEAGELDGSLPDEVKGEKVLIQGVTDGVMVNGDSAVIVDYKSDRVKSPEQLVDRYKEQMKIYCRGISEVLGKRVRGCVLYSFYLDRAIDVDLPL